MPRKTAAEQMSEYDNRSGNRPYRNPTKRGLDLSCGAACAKNTLMGMNLVFLILGAVIIGMAHYYNQSESSTLTSDTLAQAVMAMGAIVMLISFLGCCGAHNESRVLLCFYAFLLVLSILIQVIIAAVLLVDESKVEEVIEDGWEGGSDSLRADLQNNFDCCGLNQFNDTLAALPCPENSFEPCLPKLKNDLEEQMELLGIIALVVAFVQIAGVIMALCLRKGIVSAKFRRHENEGAYA